MSDSLIIDKQREHDVAENYFPFSTRSVELELFSSMISKRFSPPTCFSGSVTLFGLQSPFKLEIQSLSMSNENECTFHGEHSAFDQTESVQGSIKKILLDNDGSAGTGIVLSWKDDSTLFYAMRILPFQDNYQTEFFVDRWKGAVVQNQGEFSRPGFPPSLFSLFLKEKLPFNSFFFFLFLLLFFSISCLFCLVDSIDDGIVVGEFDMLQTLNDECGTTSDSLPVPSDFSFASLRSEANSCAKTSAGKLLSCYLLRRPLSPNIPWNSMLPTSSLLILAVRPVHEVGVNNSKNSMFDTSVAELVRSFDVSYSTGRNVSRVYNQKDL